MRSCGLRRSSIKSYPSERSFKRSSQYDRALYEVVEANDALNTIYESNEYIPIRASYMPLQGI